MGGQGVDHGYDITFQMPERKEGGTGSWPWSSAATSAGSEPTVRPRTSPPSNMWRITCTDGLPERINSARDAESPGGTMNSSRASSRHEIFAGYAWVQHAEPVRRQILRD